MEEDMSENLSYGADEDEPKQVMAYKALTDFFNSTFQYLPPQFDELFQDNPVMMKFATLVLNLLRTGATSLLTEDSIDKLELSIRGLINHQLANGTIAEMSSSVTFPHDLQGVDIQQDQAELNNLRNEVIELKGKIALLNEENRASQNQVESLRAENDDLTAEKNRLSRLSTQQKRDFNDEIAHQKYEYNTLSEKHQDAITKIKLMSGVEEGLRNQLQLVKVEADGYAQQSEKLSNSLTEKKDKIYNLRVALKKAEIKISDLKMRNSSQNSSQNTSQNSSQNYSNSPNKNPNNGPTDAVNPQLIRELNVKNELANKEIIILKQSLKERSQLIEQQSKQISQQDDRIRQNNVKIGELSHKVSDLTTSIQKGNEKIKQSDETLRNRAIELTQNRDILMKLSELLTTNYKIEKLTDIPDIVDDLLSQQISNTIAPRTLSIIDGLTRFINEVLLHDKADTHFLIEPCPSIINDRRLLNTVTNNINEIKKVIAEEYGANFTQYRMFDALLSAREHFSEDSDNCEFAALTVLCAANEKLRRICVQQKKKIENFNKIFPVESIEDSRKLFNQISKASQQYYKQSFDGNLQLLSNFFDNTVVLLGRLRNEVIPALDKNCEVLDLPDLIVTAITEVRDDVIRAANSQNVSLVQSQQNLKSSLSKCETQVEKLKEAKEKAEKMNKKLTQKVNELNSLNNILKEHLDDALNSRNEIESTFSNVNEKSQDYEETIRALKIERDRLHELLNQKQENSDARTDALIAAERSQFNIEVQRIQKIHFEEKKSLLEELEKQTQRYKTQKQKDKELMEYMEKKMKTMQNSVKDGKSPKEKVTIVTTDNFTSSIIKELKKVVQISNDWSQQKIISAIHKIVMRLLDSTTEEQWRSWGAALVNAEKNSKSSTVRKLVEKEVIEKKEIQKKNEILLFQKHVLVKFSKKSLEKKSDLSASGLVKSILFCAIAKRIIETKLKPRKSFI